MQIGEMVTAFTASMSKDPYCDKKESDSTNWQARVNNWGGKGEKCSAQRLYDCMKKDKDKKQGYLGPPVPYVAKPAATGYGWTLALCSPTHFPLQAHHVIPKNFLPDQGVCAFLAKKYSKNPKYQLKADTFYDTDHANNGYCMPYATPLAEWKGKNDAQKRDLTYKVMDQTRRQLHQGSHRAEAFDDPEAGHEEDSIHKGYGYLDTVSRFLKLVQARAANHVDTCLVCKPNAGKKEIQPLEAVVRHMDQVSGLIKLLADANWIFVSEPAWEHWNSKRSLMQKPGWL